MAAAGPPPPLSLHGRYASAPDANQPAQWLGGGSFGSVWLCTDTQTNQRVAIKRIQLDGLDPYMASILLRNVPRELRVHHSLNHPHVVKLLDAFVEPDSGAGQQSFLYLVLDLADGVFLDHIQDLMAQNNGHVPAGRARWYFQQLVVTLDYLHAKGVSHRDIKLENALYKMTGSSVPYIRLGDFGLSRFGGQANTDVGTDIYKAPEVWAGQPIHAHPDAQGGAPYDPFAADVWSAGVVLYALQAGAFPFQASTREVMLRDMHTRPLQLPDHVDPECRDLLEGMLRPNPQSA